ncbi:MAG: DUF3261 domain-containing protein [Gemmatimonadaceae bacterium]|nr:DUF3261 domain-containing protein [Gemmatimonadaceae bacterium]
MQRGDRDVTLEALLEIDPRRLTLVALGYGQRLFTLRYDGATLDEQRSPFLPSAVQGRDILADMQLALWPAESVRAALPAGWTLVEGSDERVLLHDATPVTTIRFAGAPAWRNVLVLRNHPFAYTLTITPVAER